MVRMTDTPLDGQQSLQLSDVASQAPVHLVHHALSDKCQAPAGSGKAAPKYAQVQQEARLQAAWGISSADLSPSWLAQNLQVM